MIFKFSNLIMVGIISGVIIFGSVLPSFAHPYHVSEEYPGGSNFTVTSQYKENSKINSYVAASQVAASVDPLDSCSCVVFRMDDLQDYYVDVAQRTIMQDFINRTEFFSVGPIPIVFGSDESLVNQTLSGYNAGLFEIFTHGWSHDNFTNKTLSEQTNNMTASQNALAAIFGTPPNIFIPPFNAMNQNTLTAMDSNGLEIISADEFEPGPFFIANGTSDIKDGLGIYHLPSTTKFIEYNPTPMRVSATEILENIDSDIALRGYSIITLHPQEFVIDPNDDPDVINATLYADLTTVIDGVIAKNYPIRTFNQVVAFNGTVSIDNANALEGNSGARLFNFTVTRSDTTGSMMINYTTTNGSATPGTDYISKSGIITFADEGSLTQTIQVSVLGDNGVESNETFNVNLTNCVGCTIVNGTGPIAIGVGLGTITNDDSTVTINNVTQVEGNSGTNDFVFNVTRSNNVGPISVQYQTLDETATSPTDYAPLLLGTLNFTQGGLLTQNVTVTVKGDGTVETDETFNVNLSNCVGCTIFGSNGTGTILNDDLPINSISDVTKVEGDVGTTDFVFDITRSSNINPSSVQYQTSDGTATSPGDFTALPLTTLNFGVGEITKTVTVSVNGDVVIEPNETFNVDLSNCIGCAIADNQGIGTIIDEDTLGPNIENIGSTGSGDGQFSGLASVAVDSNGRIIVADAGNDRIQVFDSAANHVQSFGTPGSGNGEFNIPSSVAVDSNDRIIVADTFNDRVQVFNSAGIYQQTIGTTGSNDGQFLNPGGVAVDSNDRIIVADTVNNRVQVFNSAGTFQQTIGSSGSGTGQFNFPGGVGVDSNDRILVADTNNARIQVFNSAGTHQQTITGVFNNPEDVTVKSIDRILVADSNNHRIQVFDSLGNHIQTIGSEGSASGQFRNPGGVAADSTDRLIVADTNNNRIQIFAANNLNDLDLDGILDDMDSENVITSSRTITSSHTVANVTVQNGVILTIPNGLGITITSGNNLTVESGGGVLVKAGGTLLVQ